MPDEAAGAYEDVTVHDIRFPWEVPLPTVLAKGNSSIRDHVFQAAMLAGIIVGGIWYCWS